MRKGEKVTRTWQELLLAVLNEVPESDYDEANAFVFNFTHRDDVSYFHCPECVTQSTNKAPRMLFINRYKDHFAKNHPGKPVPPDIATQYKSYRAWDRQRNKDELSYGSKKHLVQLPSTSTSTSTSTSSDSSSEDKVARMPTYSRDLFGDYKLFREKEKASQHTIYLELCCLSRFVPFALKCAVSSPECALHIAPDPQVVVARLLDDLLMWPLMHTMYHDELHKNGLGPATRINAVKYLKNALRWRELEWQSKTKPGQPIFANRSSIFRNITSADAEKTRKHMESLAKAPRKEFKQTSTTATPMDLIPPDVLLATTKMCINEIEALACKSRHGQRDLAAMRRCVLFVLYTYELPLRPGTYRAMTLEVVRRILAHDTTKEAGVKDGKDVNWDVTDISHSGDVVLYCSKEFKTNGAYGSQTATFGPETRRVMQLFVDALVGARDDFCLFGKEISSDIKKALEAYGGSSITSTMIKNFTSTYMRGYVATAADKRGLSDKDHENLARAETHSIAVHKQHYNRSQGTEAALAAKALLPTIYGVDKSPQTKKKKKKHKEEEFEEEEETVEPRPQKKKKKKHEEEEFEEEMADHEPMEETSAAMDEDEQLAIQLSAQINNRRKRTSVFYNENLY